MTRRVRYEVLPTRQADLKADPLLGRWTITREGERLATKDAKAEAVTFATTTARCAFRTRGQLGQVRVKTQGGRIVVDRAYGADPAPSKG